MNANNSHKNVLLTNIKQIEPSYLPYENHKQVENGSYFCC